MTSVQVQILPKTAEPVEEVIENLDETVMDNSLAPDLIVQDLNTGGEVFSQPPGVPELSEALENNETVTTKSAEMLSNDDDDVRVAAAESDDVNFSASWLDDLAPLQPRPEFADAPTVLAEDDDAGITTPEILQVLEEEDIEHAETI